MKKTIAWIAILLLLSASAGRIQAKTDSKPKLAFQIGTNQGGINDYSDLCLLDQTRVPVTSLVNAFNERVHTGYNFGLHLIQPIRKNQIEVGMDYMNNFQLFRYEDAANQFLGTRSINVNQFMLPISYNITLFRNLLFISDVQLKLGYLWQLNIIDALGTGSIPGTFINSMSKGGTFGIAASILKFRNGCKIGLYCDVYRGSHLFTDYTNQSCFPTAGSGFIKSGFRIQL